MRSSIVTIPNQRHFVLMICFCVQCLVPRGRVLHKHTRFTLFSLDKVLTGKGITDGGAVA